MPIYEQTYRTFEGETPRRAQWAIVAAQELRLTLRSRFLIYLFLAAGFHFLLRVIQIIVANLIVGDPNHPISQYLSGVPILKIDPRLFLQFLEIQSHIAFFALLAAGSGMICKDFRNNLMEVYLSKPLTWRDYLLGKVAALAGIGLVITALPALALLALHNLMDPALQTIRATYWLPLPIIAFSLLVLIVIAAAVLAASAMSPGANVAAVGLFALTLANTVLAAILPETLGSPSYGLAALPTALSHAGHTLFMLDAPGPVATHWSTPFFYATAVCVVGFLIAGRKVRRAEVEL